jgi:HEAT repeat protein
VALPPRFPTKRAASAYPAHVQDRVAALRADEQLALEEALLTALARTRHPSSSALLFQQLESQSPRRQQLAAVLLGETRLPAAASRLGELLDDSRVRGPLRAAALVGLGKLRSLPAVQRLKVEATADRSSDERRALIGALANVGNRFAHEAAPRPQSENIRRQASDALIALLPTVASNPSLAETVAQAIATVGHPSATSGLQPLAAGPDGPAKRTAQAALTLHARSLTRR